MTVRLMFYVTCKRCGLLTFVKSDGVICFDEVPVQLVTCERCNAQAAYKADEIERV